MQPGPGDVADSVVQGNVHTGNVVHNHYHAPAQGVITGQPAAQPAPVQQVVSPQPAPQVVSHQPTQQVLMGQPTVPVAQGVHPYASNVAAGYGRPLQMMSFVDAIKSCMKNSFSVEGRATRSEFWWFMLLYQILNFGGSIGGVVIGLVVSGGDPEMAALISNILGWILILPVIPAMICVSARRIHDSNKTGWLQLVPIYNLVLFIQEGDQVPNRFGPVPTNVVH